jgi:hypothetical protein
MHHMATSPEHRHMSVLSLALHAQRLVRVFVSAGTWLRLIRERGWRRDEEGHSHRGLQLLYGYRLLSGVAHCRYAVEDRLETRLLDQIRGDDASQVGPAMPFPAAFASWSFFNCFSAARRARGVSGAAIAPFVATTRWPNRIA